MNDTSIKILVGYHKPSYLFKDDIFVPIHCGRAVSNVVSKDGYVNSEDAQWLLDNTIGDDTGDNISAKNREYCECTALYWAWKNYDKLGNPDYIGFMQYRRNFILNENAFTGVEKNNDEEAYAYRSMDYPCSDYLNFLGLTKDNILNILEKYNGIITNPSNLKLVGVDDLREDYRDKISGTHVEDYDLMIDEIVINFPEMADFVKKRSASPYKSCFQMWILPRHIFFDYMEFLFSILSQCDKKINTENYSINGKRTIGYLAEILCDFYMNFYKNTYSFHSVDLCMIKNTLPEEVLLRETLWSCMVNYIKCKIQLIFASGDKKHILKQRKRFYRNLIKLIKNHAR